MAHGWMEMFRTKIRRKNEFVSADARRLSTDPRTYEMLNGSSPGLNIKSPDRALASPRTRTSFTPTFAVATDSKQDYYGAARAYVTPVSSYSHPRPPSSHKDWDPKTTHAKAADAATPSKGYDMKNYPGPPD